MYDTGLMIGHFEPLHLGQMRSILDAAGQAKTLHIVITVHPSPHPDFTITLQDKARWLQMACADLPLSRFIPLIKSSCRYMIILMTSLLTYLLAMPSCNV